MRDKKRLFIILAALLTLVTLVGCFDRDDDSEEAITTTEPADELGSAEESQVGLLSPADILQLQSDARYAFEQMFLPSVVYQSDSEEVIDLLDTLDASGMEALLLETWAHFADVFIDFSVTEGTLDAPVERDTLGLGDEHIIEVTAEMLSEDTPAFIISMLDIEQLSRSTYIAIVYHENDELQIYTLEQSNDSYMFYFVNLYSRGSFFEVENDRDAFVEAIISVLDE